jgi:hypothetical protein
MSQHVEAPGMSSAALITRGFDIRRSQAACGCKKTAMSTSPIPAGFGQRRERVKEQVCP